MQNRRLWLTWTVATALGELLGFAVPAVVGATWTFVFGEPTTAAAKALTIFVLVLAGSGEGAVLGGAQSVVLKWHIPKFKRWHFALATGLAAALAWAIGMTPSTIGGLDKISLVILIPAAVVLGVVFLLLMGTTQWFVLRNYLKRAGWWIVANAIAWPVGVSIPFVTLSLVPDQSPLAIWIAVGIASGVLMGLVVGAITGFALVRLAKKHV